MANETDKSPKNAAGRFFVDNSCIDCDACREHAPSNFTRDEESGLSYVFKQPESAEEVEQCKAALNGCPVEAIGESVLAPASLTTAS